MKKKKLWITILTLAVLAPTVVLCVLMLNSRDFSLEKFAECSSLSVTDAEGKTVELRAEDEHFLLLTKLLSIAGKSEIKESGALSERLYTVKDMDSESVCYLGIENGQAAVEWENNVYTLAYAHLKSAETVLHPRLVRYGAKNGNGYIDAPLLSQKADTVYSLRSSDDLANVNFDVPSEVSSLEILLYQENAKKPFRTFSSFGDVDFDESENWTVIVNAEVKKEGYRVQCGYEFIYFASDADS